MEVASWGSTCARSNGHSSVMVNGSGGALPGILGCTSPPPPQCDSKHYQSFSLPVWEAARRASWVQCTSETRRRWRWSWNIVLSLWRMEGELSQSDGLVEPHCMGGVWASSEMKKEI